MAVANIQPSKRGANLDRLNPKQRLFVEHLLGDKNFNPTAAAKAAGYKNPSTSANGLLKNETVSAAIGKALQERIDKTQVTAERVIYELAAIAFSNIQEVLKDDDSIKKLSSLPENVARSIQSIKVEYRTKFDEGEPVNVAIKEIKFWNKMDALQLLAKHLGMITEKHEHTGKITHVLDYDKLYQDPTTKPQTIVLDPIEYAIANPASTPIPASLAKYSVQELIEEQE